MRNAMEVEHSAFRTRITDLEHDIGKMDQEHTALMFEFKDEQRENTKKHRDVATELVVEKMKNQLESSSVYTNIEDLYETVNKLREKGLSSALNNQDGPAANIEEVQELVDGKVQNMYEKLRNDNWLIWKESIKLAEQEFSEGGVKNTMDFLPKVVYDRDDLKREINSLILEDDAVPKAVVMVPKRDV